MHGDGSGSRATPPLVSPTAPDAIIHQGSETVLVEQIQGRLRPHAPSLVPGVVVVGVMLFWAIHNGGYDPGTWYWGALLFLGMLAAMLALGLTRTPLPRAAAPALTLFGLYVAWSYLSISWAQSPGDALQGSNRALLYLLILAVMLLIPWTPGAALGALLLYTLGIGVVAVVLLARLASADHVGSLFVAGRLASPTGYLNSTAALFMIDALTATALAARRELPGLLRGVLIAIACASLQLTLIVESRGWLFTLPVVVLVALAIVPDRLRVAAAAAVPIAAALGLLHRLLDVYRANPGTELNHAASAAGRAALIICAVALVLGCLIGWIEELRKPRRLPRRTRRAAGSVVVLLAVVAVIAGGTAATHGDPLGFLSRQWHGFAHPQVSSSTGSHFADVGSGRYDFWRVAIDAVLAHPVGGLGQDNFADYYITRRHTGEEPSWTHSLELRLLAHTGFVGFALFVGFMVAAIAVALRARRRGPGITPWVAAAALIPLTVWVVHGSVDWFWEVPALTGPALGFLGVAMSLGVQTSPTRAPAAQPASAPAPARNRVPQPVRIVGGLAVLVAAVVLLGFPYLSVSEQSAAAAARARNPNAALRDLSRASRLDPLTAAPGRLAGTIALQAGDYTVAEARFGQAIDREPGGWYAWLGRGLAASALGDAAQAQRDFEVAKSINSRQPAVTAALARVNTIHPLTPAQGLAMLVIAD